MLCEKYTHKRIDANIPIISVALEQVFTFFFEQNWYIRHEKGLYDYKNPKIVEN